MDSIQTRSSSHRRTTRAQEQEQAPQAASTTEPWTGGLTAEGIPERMIDPVSKDLMLFPVVASDGHTYDKTSLQNVLKAIHPLSPMTRESLSKVYFDNHLLRSEILAFVQQRPNALPTLNVNQEQAVNLACQAGVNRLTAIRAMLAENAPEGASVQTLLRHALTEATSPQPSGAAALAELTRQATTLRQQFTPPDFSLGPG